MMKAHVLIDSRGATHYHRPVNKADLMRSIGEAHDQMAHSLDRLSDEQLLQSAMDDWTGKDVVAHMAWWHDNSAPVVEALRAGREPYDKAIRGTLPTRLTSGRAPST